MSMTRFASFPRFHRDIWMLGAAGALLTGSYLGMAQLLRVIYVLRLGRGPEFVGTLFATGSLSFMLASLPGAALGRRFGSRRMLLVGGTITVVGMATFLLTEFVPGVWRWFWPLGAEVIASAGWSILVVNMVTSLLAVTVAENRKSAYALREALAGGGMFLGALLGGMLPTIFAGLLGTTTDDTAPYRYGLAVAALLGLAGLVPLVFIRPTPSAPLAPAGGTTWSSLFPLAPLLTCGFLYNAGAASCKAFAYAYMDREFLLPTFAVGAISSVGMALAVLGALSSPGLARQRGSGFPMMVASAGLAGSLLAMALIRHWAAAGLGTISMFVLSSLFVPAYQVLQMEMADPEWRWLVAGAGNMGMSLGFGTMSVAGGYIAATAGYPRVFLLGALFALSSAAAMWSILRRRRVRAAKQSPQRVARRRL